ncbi:hypothetical protein KGP36_06145 [Patescibacteria group bacterium]|nr:hypothetical protein [Patescibacteria group bacterium]
MIEVYLSQVSNLLNDPSNIRYSPGLLTSMINIARGQVAAETECVRVPAILYTIANQQMYALASASLTATGVQGLLTVRLANVVNLNGSQTYLQPRPWEWFNSYYVGTGQSVTTGTPQVWAQQGRGSATMWYSQTTQSFGTIGLYPIPNTQYAINMDVTAVPIPLNTAFDPEAIPYPWTDAVQFYAAYMAYLSVQRFADAQNMMNLYKEFAHRGTQTTVPTVMPGNDPGGQGPKLASDNTTLTTPPAAKGGK